MADTFRERARLIRSADALLHRAWPPSEAAVEEAAAALERLASHPQDGGQRQAREALIAACRDYQRNRAEAEREAALWLRMAWANFAERWRDLDGAMVPPTYMR